MVGDLAQGRFLTRLRGETEGLAIDHRHCSRTQLVTNLVETLEVLGKQDRVYDGCHEHARGDGKAVGDRGLFASFLGGVMVVDKELEQSSKKDSWIESDSPCKDTDEQEPYDPPPVRPQTCPHQ